MGQRLAALGLILFVVSASASSPSESDPEALAKYRSFLKNLDPADVSAANRAAAEYLFTLTPEPQVVRDKAFVEFLELYSRLATSLARDILYTDEAKVWRLASNASPPQSKTVTTNSGQDVSWDTHPNLGLMVRSDNIVAAQSRLIDDPAYCALLRGNGFLWQSDGEGSFLLIHEKEFVGQLFLPYISRSLKEFVLLRRPELDTLLCADGELCLEPEELARRVRAWEKYLDDFPNSLLRKSAMHLYKSYLTMFIRLEQYHQPDKETGDNGEFAKVWSKYARDYPKAQSGALAAKYLDLLRAHNFENGNEQWRIDFFAQLDAYLNELSKEPADWFVPGVFLPDKFREPWLTQDEKSR